MENLLIRVHKVQNFRHPYLNLYQVTANGLGIGYIEKWESYIWDIDSPYVNTMGFSRSKRKLAVDDIVKGFKERIK
jgi:hypothetical protein